MLLAWPVYQLSNLCWQFHHEIETSCWPRLKLDPAKLFHFQMQTVSSFQLDCSQKLIKCCKRVGNSWNRLLVVVVFYLAIKSMSQTGQTRFQFRLRSRCTRNCCGHIQYHDVAVATRAALPPSRWNGLLSRESCIAEDSWQTHSGGQAVRGVGQLTDNMCTTSLRWPLIMRAVICVDFPSLCLEIYCFHS